MQIVQVRCSRTIPTFTLRKGLRVGGGAGGRAEGEEETEGMGEGEGQGKGRVGGEKRRQTHCIFSGKNVVQAKLSARSPFLPSE